MARQKILFNGCYSHVFSRALEGRSIFETDEDFAVFKEFLEEARDKHEFKIHHYCLMNTHFHLVVSMPYADGFSKGMQEMKCAYTKYYNLTRKRWGTLWRERFKSMLIEDERYLYACGLYVEQNPVKAKMVKNPEEWEYSSSRYYFLNHPDRLIHSYEFYGNKPKGIDIEDDKFFTQGNVVGTEFFKLQVREGMFIN